MSNAESRFADLTPSAGALGRLPRIGIVICVVALAVAASASSALATPHPALTGEYGKEGLASTGLGAGCRLAYQNETDQLYLSSDSKIYTLKRNGVGSVTPLGSFSATSSGCGDPSFAVDNSAGASKNNLYGVTSSASMSGWNSAGTALSGWPVSNGSGETCGVAVTNTGEVWGWVYNQGLKKWSPAGASLGSVANGFAACKIAVDQSNNDLYVAPYQASGAIRKYTAASGYTSFTTLSSALSGNNNPGLAVNGVEHRLYIGDNTSTVRVYDTVSGALVESINIGTAGGRGIAVDEETDSLFVAVGSGASGRIKEFAGITTPKATTGEPTADAEVSGNADPNGVGPITECYFEWGPTPSYGSKQNCTESVPFNTTQNVHAVLPGVTPEATYHYRLVLDTGAPFVVGKGADRTITPHNVHALKTLAAEDIARSTATLKGSFEGNGEATHYYFEWGPTTAYGTTSATPPGPSIGSPTFPPTTPLTFSATGLESETVYHYRVVAENGIGLTRGEDRTFETPPAVQSLTTGGADATPGHATLHASYLGDGNPTSYYFEYIEYVDYQPLALNPYEGGQTTAVFPGTDAGSGSGPQELSSVATGLEPYVEYHYRVVATNKFGTTHGADETFFSSPPTLPSVSATYSSAVTETGATLNAQINPGGGPTVVRFEYGPSSAYGSRTAATAPVGSDEADHLATAAVSGLEPGTTYHFRVLATNFAGSTYGPDMTMTTSVPPSPPGPGPQPAISTQPPGGEGPAQMTSCTELERRARQDLKRAERLRRKARHASARRSRALRQKADQLAKQSKKLNERAKACRERAR